jgi:hypothetical protein
MKEQKRREYAVLWGIFWGLWPNRTQIECGQATQAEDSRKKKIDKEKKNTYTRKR